jgi:peptidoglycan-N-acetylglucosamine deacetylase
MKTLIKLLIFFSLQSIEAKEIALTFDDSPRFAKGVLDGPTRAQNLISALKAANIEQVAFFTNSSFMDDEGTKRINSYIEAGHIIANHTHTHPDFNKTSLQNYIQDFDQAHDLLKNLPTFIKWFRFPYLREGNDLEKRDGMREHLKKNGYINAYITVDFSDWHLEHLYQKAHQDKKHIDLERLKKLYIDNALAAAEYYDEMAKKYLKRSPKHVMLLHETDLAAFFIQDMIEAFRKHGWTIISPQEAYTDDLLHFQFNDPLAYNPGRVSELAYQRGLPRQELWAPQTNTKEITKSFQEVITSP